MPFFEQLSKQTPENDSAKRRLELRLNSLALNPEVQNLLGYIMENTMYNLIQEIALGEFDPTSVPKKFMFTTNDEVEEEIRDASAP